MPDKTTIGQTRLVCALQMGKIKEAVEILSNLYLAARAPKKSHLPIIQDALIAIEQIESASAMKERLMPETPPVPVAWEDLRVGETYWGVMEEARSKIEKLRLRNAQDGVASLYSVAKNDAFQKALSLLSRVEIPSEEDRAVLWLIKEHGWSASYNKHAGKWEGEVSGSCWDFFNPSEEAEKLGWKP